MKKTSKVTYVRLSDELRQVTKDAAKAEDRDMSALIRRAIVYYIAEMHPALAPTAAIVFRASRAKAKADAG